MPGDDALRFAEEGPNFLLAGPFRAVLGIHAAEDAADWVSAED